MRQSRPHSRRGTAVLFTIFLLVALFAIISLAVDWGTVQLARSQLQATTDAACLAAAGGLPISPAEARSRARQIAAQNLVRGKSLTLLDSDIELGLWNRSAGVFTKLAPADEYTATAVRINTQLSQSRGSAVPLTFASLLGVGAKELVASGIAGFAQAADVVLVQDITNSFSAELGDAKVADQALLDTLYANGTGRSNFGVVVHTGWGKTLRGLKDISDDYANLSSTISKIGLAGTSGMPAASGTDIAAGLQEAINVFDAYDYSSKPSAVRAIVLVSDGEPTANTNGSHPKLNATQLMTLAQQTADAAWAKKIHVYIVYFNRDGDQTAAAKVAALARGSGDFVQVSDPKQLPSALEKLTRRLPMALLR